VCEQGGPRLNIARATMAVGTSMGTIVLSLACGSVQPHRSPAPAWPAAGAGAVVVTWNDDRQSRTVTVGQEIDIRLAADQCSVTSTPTTADQTVLASEQVGTIGGSAWAQFRAVGKGSATIAAVNKPSCKGHPSALLPAHGFVFTVVVQ
jgi:hypothetical protein